MFLVDGEWLDHGDPRVDAMWTNRLTGVPAPTEHRTVEEYSTLAACRAILGQEDEDMIEAAADYAEDSYGCLAARMAYGAPITRRNMQDLER